jgi:asparagine synthase (glutamine-hydrolysing)
MSVQAGILNFDSRPADLDFLGRFSSAIEQFGPDGGADYIDGPLGMAYRAFHTTLESRLERQPHRSGLGTVITWDGRLDNRDDLISQVRHELTEERTDVAIVAAAYEKWGLDCFCRLIGDWALSIWDSRKKALILARDYVGVRHLYYYPRPHTVTWCTNLAALVLFERSQFTLNDEYIAGFLALWPDAQLTPYREIHAVPPGKFVRIADEQVTIKSYWSFDIDRRILYKTDAEYEEHFRHAFRQAVRRRLRSDSPILAELSGGLDSSSIVCVADDIIAKGEAESPRMDTTSRYDPEEPGGDERPYFTKVEEKRGRTGFHVDLRKCSRSFLLQFDQFVATPGSMGNGPPNPNDETTVGSQQLAHRVLLSGVGGDEFMGGVPDPNPFLADLLVKYRFREFAKQLMAWSLVKKRPLIQLFCQCFALLLPAAYRIRRDKQNKPEPWLAGCFANRYWSAIRRLAQSENLGFQLPTQRSHAETFVGMARQMSISAPPLRGCQEKRYPYLDRDLIEFIVAIPADQLLRPGQRRSLMRRALADCLPPEILARATKATTARAYMVIFETQWPQLENILKSPLSSRLGFIDAQGFRDALAAAKSGNSPHLPHLLRGLSLELWLQDSARRGVIGVPDNHERLCRNKLCTPERLKQLARQYLE